VTEDVPVNLEWNLPTAGRGAPRLSQAYAEYNGVRRIKFQLGKFMVPFGRYNELYRPDQYLAVTRPLLYASPDSLDLVVRPNSPRPPISYGYSDIGLRWSWYPVRVHPLVPSEATLFVVKGVGEQKNRLRTFPNPSNLGIPGPGTSGGGPDFGHENNNLADNNNAKTFGGRVVFALGDLRLPWPVPEKAADLAGTHLGLSGMGGNYDLEGFLSYEMWSAEVCVTRHNEAVCTAGTTSTPLLAPAPGVLARAHEPTRQVEHCTFRPGLLSLMRRPPYGGASTQQAGPARFPSQLQRRDHDDRVDDRLPRGGAVRHAADQQIHGGRSLAAGRAFRREVRVFVLGDGEVHDSQRDLSRPQRHLSGRVLPGDGLLGAMILPALVLCLAAPGEFRLPRSRFRDEHRSDGPATSSSSPRRPGARGRPTTRSGRTCPCRIRRRAGAARRSWSCP
jgi:hypothetical protein